IDNNVVAEDVTSQTVPVHEEDVRVIDHYLARLDGDVVSVYICGNFGEEFLYNLDVYLNDLPKGDIEKLKAGVVLKTKQELTSFEEDYTS
ncbi:MAG: hypothetical protein RR957_02750, partial [Oscillospiraceae bacterium]